MAVRTIYKVKAADVYPYYVAKAVEEIEDRITEKGHHLDKLVDKLAKRKAMKKILRKK